MSSLKERLEKIKVEIPALYFAMTHKKTPWLPKALAVLTVTYALSPIDLIPDFIPVLGFVDDALILPGMIALTIRLIPKSVMEECRVKAKTLWDEKGMSKWYYGIPVILFYLLVSLLVIYLIVS